MSDELEAFDTWWIEYRGFADPHNGDTWSAWQARAALAQQQPAQCPFPILGDNGSVEECVRHGHCGCGEQQPAQGVDEVMRLAEEFAYGYSLVPNAARKTLRAAIERLAGQAASVKALPIQWEQEAEREWSERRYGFYISHDADYDQDKPYSATWGESDDESFATLEEAQAWCQSQIDTWIAGVVVIAGQAASAEPVAWQKWDEETRTMMFLQNKPRYAGWTPLYPLNVTPPAAVPEGWQLVPKSAIAWLMGEAGEFECPPSGYFRGKPAPYWWRTEFRKLLAATPQPIAQPEQGE